MNASTKTTARSLYHGSHGGKPRSYLCRLEKEGHLGCIAAQLFRTQKASAMSECVSRKEK